MNILDSIKGLVSEELLGQISGALGEDQNAITKVAQGAIPTVLSGLLGSDKNQHASISGLMGQAANNSNLIGDLLGGISGSNQNSSGFMDSIISGIFGDKASGILNILTNLGGFKNANSSKSILGMVGGLISSFFGKKMMSDGLNFSSLLNLIGGEKESIMKAAPAGIGDMLGISNAPWQKISDVANNIKESAGGAISGAANATSNAVEEGIEGAKSGMKWLWPLLLLALLGFGIWFFLKGCNKDETNAVAETSMNSDADTKETESEATPVTKATGSLNADGDWIVVKGDSMTIKLDNGMILNTFKGSGVDRLYNFITDASAVPDKQKAENWFNFEDILFESGSSKLKPGFNQQVENTVAILNAFPNVKVKLGGYTDNTGDSLGNMKLSEQRAKMVYNTLISKGANKASFADKAYEGYGSQYPVADNATKEGQAQNRRIAIVVENK